MVIKPVTGIEINASHPERLSQQGRLTVGVQYAGKIIGMDAQKLAAVQIGGQIFSMELPDSYRVGETVQLKYLGGEPKPTFLFLQPSTVSTSGFISLSQASKLILEVLATSAQLKNLNLVSGSVSPLFQSPINTQLSILELQNALAYSGLFYESHIANFMQGRRTLDQLKREMQNQKDVNRSQIIAKQLEFLENQQIQWSGMIWPGQYMHWTMKKGSDYSESDLPDEQSCQSKLELDLPGLGKIIFHLEMGQGRMNIRIELEKPSSKRIVEAGIPKLRQKFENFTSQLDQVSVSKSE